MMAMTPYEKKTLEEIESAFFEAVETRRAAPSAQVAKTIKKQPIKKTAIPTTTAPPRRGWFGGLKERVVMTFVCCAPPQTLLDDDEIQEILAKIDEPVKPSSGLPPRAPSRKDSLLRRNSASVMPASRAVDSVPTALEKPSLSDITHVLDRSKQSINEEEVAPVAEVEELVPRAHVSLAAMQRVVVALLALHKAAEKRQTERAVLAVQMKWRRRQPVLTAPIATAPATPSASLLTPTTPTAVEPDFEPKTDDHATTTATAASPVSPKRRRDRKTRVSKKTKFAAIPHAVTQETAHAVESLTQLALTRKRLRSVDLESRAPCVDVERDVHVLFGDEEIDDDEDDEVVELAMTGRAPQPVPCFALQRCASVPPPPTAFRPRPVKTKTLLEGQAAMTIQRAWRGMKSRQEREIQRRLAKYEAQKQSVMPTIRNKMLELRKRLEEMQERHSDALVAVVVPEPVALVAPAPVDDDYDWL